MAIEAGSVTLKVKVDVSEMLDEIERVALALERAHCCTSRWRRSPRLVAWGARAVDYQIGDRDDRRRMTRA